MKKELAIKILKMREDESQKLSSLYKDAAKLSQNEIEKNYSIKCPTHIGNYI